MSKKEQLRKAYDEIAKKYGGYRRKLWPKVVSFLKSSKPTAILDMGSGRGQYIPLMEDLGHKVILSDFSIEHLKLAKKSGLKNPSIVSDVTSMPIKNESFDIITSIAVFHHMPTNRDRVNFIKEIKRILKPGGKAMLTSFGANPSLKQKRGFSGYLKFGDVKRFCYFYTESEIKNYLSEAGFESYKVEGHTKNEIEIITNNKQKIFTPGNYLIKIKK